MVGLAKQNNILVLIATSIGSIMNPFFASMIVLAMPVIGAGMASSIVAIMRQYGMLFSTAICMTSIAVFIGGSTFLEPSVYGEFTHAFQMAMLICAGLGIIGAIFSWFRGPIPVINEEEKE